VSGSNSGVTPAFLPPPRTGTRPSRRYAGDMLLEKRRSAAIAVAVAAALALLLMHGGLDAHATYDHHAPAHGHAMAGHGSSQAPHGLETAETSTTGSHTSHHPMTHLVSLCLVVVLVASVLWSVQRRWPQAARVHRQFATSWVPLRDAILGPVRLAPRSVLCVELR
jgi:hypothetical protein